MKGFSRQRWLSLGLLLAGAVLGYFLLDHKAGRMADQSEQLEQADPVRPEATIADADSSGVAPHRGKKALPASSEKYPPGAIPGEAVLTFANERDFQEFLKLARSLGITKLDALPRLHAVRIGTADMALLGALDGAMDYNYVVAPPEIPEPRADADNGGGTEAFGADALKWLGATAATAEWGQGVTIAVLDTGVDPNTPVAARLAGVIDITGDGLSPPEISGHGTAIATLLLGEPGRVEGAAAGSRVLSVRVIGADGAGDTFTLARGIVAAVDAGAQVLSLSLGSFGDSSIVRDAVAYAQSKGAVLVAAVGNESTDTVAYPARYPGVIGVTATDAAGQVPSFANRGPEVDIAAPGVGVLTRWDSGHGVAFTGTSAAVPFVSATVAGLMSQRPGQTATATASLISAYGNDAGAPGLDPVYGAGLLNYTRLLQRDTPGIYSLAVADFTLAKTQAGTTGIPLVVTVQNRGTTPLDNVLIETHVAGATSQQFIQRLTVGQSASASVRVPASGTTTVSASARSMISGTIAPAKSQTFTITPAR